MHSKLLSILILALLGASQAAQAAPWTYRGNLNDGGKPANGSYDLRLTLTDAAGVRAIGQPLTLYGVAVKDGNFSADVDFGVDLSNAPALKLKTEVAQGGSGFASLGEPTRFDPKAALAGICWDTTGNVVAAGEFLGASNDVGVEIKANNLRVARFKAAGSAASYGDAPQVLLGSAANIASGVGASVGGGGSTRNDIGVFCLTCGNRATGDLSTISGGYRNLANNSLATIAGGSTNTASDSGSTVGGGVSNTSSGSIATISGGDSNTASGARSAIGGGGQNIASGGYSFVGGGLTNDATGSYSVIGGGQANFATGVLSFVGGGQGNDATGASSVVSGGFENCAGGDNSWAGGREATTRSGNEAGDGSCGGVFPDANGDEGTFVWADASIGSFTSTGPNQFLVRADGGLLLNSTALVNSLDDVVLKARAGTGDSDMDLRLVTRSNKSANIFVADSSGTLNVQTSPIGANSRLTVSGGSGGTAFLSNGGTWTNASSRTFKNGFALVDAQAILNKVAALPISTWTYIDSDEGSHMGPMAEDFKAAFGLAGDGKSIATVDADGVALAAIQGLNQKLEAENAKLNSQLNSMLARIALLENAR